MIIILGSIGTYTYSLHSEKQKQLARQKQLEQEYEQAKEAAVLDQIGEINEKHWQDSLEGNNSKPQYDNLDIFRGSGSSYSYDDSNSSSDTDTWSSDDYNDSPEPFYGIWCEAYKTKSDAKKGLKVWKNRGFDANIYITTQWSNLNSEKWYVISTGEFASKSEAKSTLSETKKVL